MESAERSELTPGVRGSAGRRVQSVLAAQHLIAIRHIHGNTYESNATTAPPTMLAARFRPRRACLWRDDRFTTDAAARNAMKKDAPAAKYKGSHAANTRDKTGPHKPTTIHGHRRY